MGGGEPGAPYYLGVDGGGTHTRAVVVDAGGHEAGRGLAGSANPQVAGLMAAVEHIHRAVAGACRTAGVRPPLTAAWCGVSGIDRPVDSELLRPYLSDLATSVRLTNDADLGLAALPGGWGVCLIAGTGSIAVGQDPTGRHVRAGGWGFLLGDEGSGYDLGLRALHAVVRAMDGRGPPTALREGVLRAWALPTPADLIGVVHGADGAGRIASLAEMVCAAAGRGDPVAQAIVAAGAVELAGTVLAVARQLVFPGALPLALVGGLLVAQPAYRTAIIARIQEERAAVPVVVPDPAMAAARAVATAR